jgi:hypothetical protein
MWTTGGLSQAFCKRSISGKSSVYSSDPITTCSQQNEKSLDASRGRREIDLVIANTVKPSPPTANKPEGGNSYPEGAGLLFLPC